MNKLSQSLRYLFPEAIIPFTTKVITNEDGFLLNDKTVLLRDIDSVFYVNFHSQDNKADPLGNTHYEILTKDNFYYFYGEQDELAQFFDQKLAVESLCQHKVLGFVKRWRQVDGAYRSVSLGDSISAVLERSTKAHISGINFVLVIAGLIILFITVVIVIPLLFF